MTTRQSKQVTERLCGADWEFEVTGSPAFVKKMVKQCVPEAQEAAAMLRLSRGNDATTVKTSPRTKTFQTFMDSLKTPHRKVPKLSLDYATRR